MMNGYNTLQSAFEAAADKYSEYIALKYRDFDITYKKLDELANEICFLLRRRFNEKNDARIAILVENHSILRYVYMLGVLKAGYTYVPLDAKAISERSLKILDISDAEILLTEKGFEEFTDTITRSGIMKNEDIIFTALSELKGMERQDIVTDGERSAYIIFTSGSTGEPKGVEVQDKAVLNFSFSIISKLDISHDDKTLSLSNFSFDASVFDMYPFLFAGAEIIMISESERHSIASLNSYMVENGVTIQCVTTALYHLLLNEENSVLKKMCVIGEKMMSYKEKSYEIYNMYGPTETTCLVTLARITRNYDDIPAGYPIDNVNIGIINDKCELLPCGQKGEIVIGGVCLAKGYYGNIAETKKHFITISNGTLVYRTGDIGSLDDDGNLHCFGRLDNQIKYKGYRIELDEIRKTILKYEGVSDAAVLFIEHKLGSFIASVVCTSEVYNENSLRTYLKKQLPDYMIPSKIIFMDEFPLNRNKKVDSAALKRFIEEKYITSCSENSEDVEKTCRSLWSSILCIPTDIIQNNVSFREHGGDSLQMLTMIAEVNKKFGIQLPFELFIAETTIDNLISVIKEAKVN